jgi:conjugal transfer pilin signal peptidase TrbI
MRARREDAPPCSRTNLEAVRRGTARRFRPDVAGLVGDVRRRWLLYLPLLVIWVMAYVRVFVDPTPRVPLLFNWTGSLPYRVVLLQHDTGSLRRGDLIVYSFDGAAQERHPGLRGQPFFKRVRGVPGDVVTVTGHAVAVNGEPVGAAKARALDRRALHPIEPVVIPPGYLYVEGSSPDSFDSRYLDSGLVRIERVVGTVIPIF